MKRREIARRHLDGALRGVQSDEGEVDTALEIDGPQSRIILRFGEPVSLEVVERIDGIAGQEVRWLNVKSAATTTTNRSR